MNKIFHKPTPFIVPNNIKKPGSKGSLFMVGAKKEKLSARVGVKDTVFGVGPPAINILGPHIYGGTRKPKGSEKAMRASGVIGGGKFIAPSKSLRLNSYGNVAGGQMQKILSSLKSLRGAASGITTKSDYFVMRLGGAGSETGIWQRTSKKKIKKLFNIINSPKYRPRFKFDKISNASIKRHYKKNFDKSLANALATAK